MLKESLSLVSLLFGFPFSRDGATYALLPAAPCITCTHVIRVFTHTRARAHTGAVFFSLSASDSQSVGFPKGVTKARRRRRSPECNLQTTRELRSLRDFRRVEPGGSCLRAFPAAFPFLLFSFHPVFVEIHLTRFRERELPPRDHLIAMRERRRSRAARTISPDNIESRITARATRSRYEMTAAWRLHVPLRVSSAYTRINLLSNSLSGNDVNWRSPQLFPRVSDCDFSLERRVHGKFAELRV